MPQPEVTPIPHSAAVAIDAPATPVVVRVSASADTRCCWRWSGSSSIPRSRWQPASWPPRDVLNGYQKGLCFYCFGPIAISPDHPNLADVDHFFPWRLKRDGFMPDADGIWNLVLACRDCNRGEGGKFAHIPAPKFLERLHRRNSYLIDSHHPLRQTLMMQIGRTDVDRVEFLRVRLDMAIVAGLHPWDPPAKGHAGF